MLRIRLLATLSICLVLPCALNAADGAGDLPAKNSVTLTQATHVVIGTVRNLYAKKIGGGADEALSTRSLLEIDVLEVEKGRGLPVGNVLYVANTRMVRQGRVAVQFPSTPPTPAEADIVRLFLRYHPQTDGTFEFLDHPRAAQILKHAKDKVERGQTAGTRAIGEFVRAGGYAIWVDEDEGHLMIRRHGTEDDQRTPLSKLPVLRDVKRLTLRGRSFGDADLQALAAWKDLEGLQVIFGQVTDADLRQIARLTNLKRLLLWGTRTTGAGLKHLTVLERLAYLEIQDTPLGDADLEALKQLPGLRVLRLLGTHATDRGMEKLQAALPRCKIEAGPGACQRGAVERGTPHRKTE